MQLSKLPGRAFLKQRNLGHSRRGMIECAQLTTRLFSMHHNVRLDAALLHHIVARTRTIPSFGDAMVDRLV
jgi:hypothetical protein